MGKLDDMMIEDAAVFTDPDGFGESVVYKPAPGGGAPVPIDAVVIRNPLTDVDEIPPGSLRGSRIGPEMIITIRNHPTLGRTAINTGVDKIAVADRVGGTVRDHLVGEVLGQDAGMWRLRVR